VTISNGTPAECSRFQWAQSRPAKRPPAERRLVAGRRPYRAECRLDPSRTDAYCKLGSDPRPLDLHDADSSARPLRAGIRFQSQRQAVHTVLLLRRHNWAHPAGVVDEPLADTMRCFRASPSASMGCALARDAGQHAAAGSQKTSSIHAATRGKVAHKATFVNVPTCFRRRGKPAAVGEAQQNAFRRQRFAIHLARFGGVLTSAPNRR